MKKIVAIGAAVLVSSGVEPALAQALSSTECKEVLQTYGVLPSSCPTSGSARDEVATEQAPTTSARLLDEPTQEMRQNNIYFAQGGDRLTPRSILQLQRLASVLNSPSMSHACIRLVGHSDSSGSDLINMEVGAKRAVAVRNQLALLLQDPSRIEETKSMGEASPQAEIPAESAWQRRVEIWARDCPGYSPG